MTKANKKAETFFAADPAFFPDSAPQFSTGFFAPFGGSFMPGAFTPGAPTGWDWGWNGRGMAGEAGPWIGWRGAPFEDEATWAAGWSEANGIWGSGFGANDNLNHCSGSWFEAHGLWRGVRAVDSLAALIREAAWADQPLCFNHAFTPEELEKLAFLLGESAQGSQSFGWVREFPFEAVDAATFSDCGQVMHTEGPFWSRPPSMFMLFFGDAEAGAEPERFQFLPIYEVLAQLDGRFVQALTQGRARFVRQDQQGVFDSWEGPLLSRDPFGRFLFRWRFDAMVRPEAADGSEDTQGAIEAVKALIDSLPRTEFVAEPGQLVLCPNHTWLHARSGGCAHSERSIWRSWVG